MVYAQITNGIVQNTVILEDASLESLFSDGFDYFIQIDNLNPQPGIGWGYDGTNFSMPAPAPALPLNQRYTKAEFGQLLIDQFTASNIDRGLTSAQLFALAQSLSPFYILLQTGSLQAFLDNLHYIPVDGTVITSGLIAQFQGSVQAYLAGY